MNTAPRASEAPRALVILGQPVAQSLSPVFQSAALNAVGRAVTYERREVSASELTGVLATFRETRTGGNVTMPHKQAVYAACALRSTAAERTGAVNTFWWDGAALVGHNTDIDGILATITALCPHGIAGDVVLVGAGGAAAAVLVALDGVGDMSTRLHLVTRTPDRAVALVANTALAGQQRTVLHHADSTTVPWSSVSLVVNATPLGMRDGDGYPVPLALLRQDCAVYDLVYRASGTEWVHAARARGLIAEDGLRMLVEQGASAFECWFGIEAPRSVMWEALGAMVPPANAPRAMRGPGNADP
ncbi:shikimate dehydrogenase [Gemmatimonas sp.]|uniref:shikimate dehydrogenase family protein n=1 Tax=Gemmatimonas sp. TaxID=1962908 RepID=UPI00333F83BD